MLQNERFTWRIDTTDLPTSHEAKYKAKQVIDGLCMRLGDVIQAGIVFGGTQLQWSVKMFASLDVVLILVWFAIVIAVVRGYRAKVDRVNAPAGVTPQLVANEA